MIISVIGIHEHIAWLTSQKVVVTKGLMLDFVHVMGLYKVSDLSLKHWHIYISYSKKVGSDIVELILFGKNCKEVAVLI